MTGAEIQLVARGIQDIYITENPQITYFKVVYRRHTNFSMEAIPQYFNSTPNFGKKYTCTINANGDLMAKTYLVIKLPQISYLQPEDVTKKSPYFAWVKKIGYNIIKTIEIEIGGFLICRHYGEWLNIIDELFTPIEKKRGQDIMIGNTNKLYALDKLSDDPSLNEFYKESTNLYIPLEFWFCRNISQAIPLVSLYHSEIKIILELNDIEYCHLESPSHFIQTYDDLVSFNKGDYIYQNIDGKIAAGIFDFFDPLTKKLYYLKLTRNKFEPLPKSDIPYNYNQLITTYYDYAVKSRSNNNYFCFINQGATTFSYQNISVDSLNRIMIKDCYLLVNYIYLDAEERNRFVQNKHDYLIEQLEIFNPQSTISSNCNFNVDSINPSKYYIWYTQQQYLKDPNVNDHFNFTDDYMYTNNNETYRFVGESLIKNASLLFNGKERVSNRNNTYYNYYQPYNYFTKTPSNGINVYSFGLFNNDLNQPNGSANMSFINNVNLQMQLSTIINNSNNASFTGFSVNYNILRIDQGLAGVLFT